MKFRVGQRVRLLHESGEGVVTQLIDNKHVEVDLGDDFPIDMHIDEIIAIDRSEQTYLAPEEEDRGGKTANPVSFGINITEISLVAAIEEKDTYGFYLMNPEPAEMLYTCFSQYQKYFEGSASGNIPTDEFRHLFTLTSQQLGRLKGFRFQILSFIPGKGHPQSPLMIDFSWGKNRFQQPAKDIKHLHATGWIFPLREDLQKQAIDKMQESEFIRVKNLDTKPYAIEFKPEIDLHIEELVENPLSLAPSEIIKLQVAHVEKSLAEALLNNYPGMVIIHGVGTGTLKQAVKLILEASPHVKSFSSADPKRYGNGATEVQFK